eukprot:gnl/TRDRNA2_/TRDRNA2_82294_c1_seq1.p1 gnl/TRDRNA2_/TRDRNA2_82294_c1~~gnl/TRDRNA2_/TRDRNA2_82294_c1_seq1.p1  ORF type:complete len:311 (+),score=32.78 gnl/TRDRNA2_/TRDRNA2_82294_c1_seq1:42-935(+)
MATEKQSHLHRFICLLAVSIFAALLIIRYGFAETARESRTHSAVSVMGRKAFIYKPVPHATSSGGPMAGIVVLHGSDGVAQDMYDVGFESLADVHNFLVIYPEMQVPRSEDWGYKSDIPYFAALLDRLQQEDFGLDAARVFVCGHSAGGTLALFLQNEMDEFQAAAAVEAGVAYLDTWRMSRRGHRTMVVWNHADPVLREYAPHKNETAMYQKTVSTLRRHGSLTPAANIRLPVSKNTLSAELVLYLEDSSPELLVLSWRSVSGTHEWPTSQNFSFDAAHQLTRFFLDAAQPLMLIG